MENDCSRLFYAGIAYGEYPEPGSRLAKTGLPVRRLGREYPYLLGRQTGRQPGYQARRQAGRQAPEKMQIYHALLPEYCGKTFFSKRPKAWKRETAAGLLREVGERARSKWDCREQVFAPQLGGEGEAVPPELLAVCLYRCRPFDRLCVSLEEEKGQDSLSQALELMIPWLPRLRQVMFYGEESEASLTLEDFLYGEFGIILLKTERTPFGMPWLDLRREEVQRDTSSGQPVLGAGVECGTNHSAGDSAKRQKNNDTAYYPDRDAGHSAVRVVSRAEAIKFLDTAVKNGYNTKVN